MDAIQFAIHLALHLKLLPIKSNGLSYISDIFGGLRLRHPQFSFNSVDTHSTPYGVDFIDLSAFVVAFRFSSNTLTSIHSVVEIVVF